MTLIVYFDGQYWIGIVEERIDGQLKVYRYLFGSEPKEGELWQFINKELPKLLLENEQKGIKLEKESQLRTINPKRRQRQVAKELQQRGTSTKSQQAVQQALEEKKEVGRKRRKVDKQAAAERAYQLRMAKAKKKKRGH